MQLTDQQRHVIIAWAERTPEIEAVILYGSWYIGTAKPEADVTLALGLSGQQRAINYLQNFESWEAQLKATAGLNSRLVTVIQHWDPRCKPM